MTTIFTRPKPRVKYLANKEILFEINKSKKTYCSFAADEYADFDFIIAEKEDLKNPEIIQEAKLARAKRLKELKLRDLLLQGISIKKQKIQKEEIDEVLEEDIVYRFMTKEHFSQEILDRLVIKGHPELKIKLPFPPFTHYILKDGKERCVGKSHWIGGLDNGQFCISHGLTTDRLAKMYMKLVSRYSKRPNWSGYTYLDEMQGQALLQLAGVGLKFDESKSANPFAFYTTIITHSFTGALNIEKKNQNLRDDLLIEAGAKPSFSRQTNDLIKNRK